MKKYSSGQTVAQLVISGSIAMGASLAFVYTAWVGPLQTNEYEQYGTTQSLSASVSDIKQTVDDADLPRIREEVDFLAQQKGFVLQTSTSTSY